MRGRPGSLQFLRLLLVVWAGAAVWAIPVAAAESTSANYRLERQTVNDAGEAVMSTSYVLKSSSGQESATGTSSSFHFVLESGFWSFAGVRIHPIALEVEHDPSDAQLPRLFWSGTEVPFVIYRAADCASLALNPLVAQNAKNWTDPSPPPDPLVCYRVLSTAPGDGQGLP